MAADEDKWAIEKLNGSNWSTWKFQMKHVLLAKDLWGLVDGTEAEPAEDAAARVLADYRKRSQKAFSVIALAISSSQLYLVTSCEQPGQAWKALRNHFERDTLANKLLLKKRYFRSEMKEGTSVEKHLKNMKELTEQLAAIGAPIDEEDQVVTLLGSLPKSYSTFVTALQARETVSLTYLQQALTQEEQKLQGRDPQRDAALVGETRRRRKQHQKPVCFGCQQPGHFRRDCPKARRAPPAHKAETANEDKKGQETSGAFAASMDSSLTTTWLVDSGASSHMTWDKRLLTNYQEFVTPEKVGLGDGRTVDALGVGDIHLRMEFKVSQPRKSVMHRVMYVPKLARNLFSVRAATTRGNMVKFGHSRCWIRDRFKEWEEWLTRSISWTVRPYCLRW